MQKRGRENDWRREPASNTSNADFSHPVYSDGLLGIVLFLTLFHTLFNTFPYFSFLIPKVQDGCFLQPANTLRADNLGILYV